MASKMSLMVAIGGAVNSSVGAAFSSVEGRIKKLEDKGNKAKVLKSTIGETMRLRDEWKKAHDSGSASADGLRRKLESNLDSLRKQGVQVSNLRKEYQQLQRVAKGTDLQMKGHQQIEQGRAGLKTNMGQAVVGVGALGVAGKISADYQAIIRDIAIKADVANKPQEAQMTRTVIQTSQETGMARNDVADLVNQLVGAGMELDKALSYAPVAAKFAIGQGASGVDTASMIQALQQNAKITDPKLMQQALEAIALQGQAGSFEAADMAKWFPQLLASMEKNGSTGMDAVSSLGAMLQVQMKTAGGSDEAANNLKNWMEKIGSGDVVKAYKDAGIDYQASLNSGIQQGMSTLESSFALAMKYVQATDPAKAAKMAEAQAKISKETDPEKAKAMLNALEQSLRTGDIFADMQVKAALTAYAANRGLYEQLKKDSQSAAGILDKNLAERRETSSQLWAEAGQAANDGLRSIGDAIRPVTDLVAVGIKKVAHGLTGLSDGSQSVVLGITALGAAFVAFKTVLNGIKVARGVANIGRGALLARGGGAGGALGGAVDAMAGNGRKTGIKPVDTGLKALGGLLGASNDADGGRSSDPQRVFVVNADALGAGVGPGAGRSARRRQRGGRRGRNVGASVSRKAPRVPVAARPVPKLPAAALPKAALAALPTAADVGGLGKVVKGMRGVTALGKRLPGGAVLDAGLGGLDTALNAKTQDEKAEGYGSAAGGLAGSLAGAAAGAAIGSVVPVIGTVIGGAVGAIIGGMGGESLGGMLGKSLFGSEEKKEGANEAGGAEKDQAKSVEVVPVAPSAPAQEAPKVRTTLNAAPVEVATVKPPVPAVSYDPAAPDSKDPFAVPALTENKVRFPGAPLVAPASLQEAPKARTTLNAAPVEVATVKPLAPAVSYDPLVADSKDPFAVPALTENKVRFPGAPLVAPAPLQEAPKARTTLNAAPVEVATVKPPAPAVSYDPLNPDSKDPFLVPALTENKVRFPRAPLSRPESAAPLVKAPQLPVVQPADNSNGMGDVVRALVASTKVQTVAQPAPVKPAEKVKPEAPKVDQTFSIALSMPVTVQGDVKDPQQVVRDLEGPLRSLFDSMQRDLASRQSSVQLFDSPHV